MAPRDRGLVVERRLDEARLTLPRDARGLFGAQAELCADLSGCILLTPTDAWRERLAALQQSSAHNHHAAELFRLLAASATTAEVDARGRLTLPHLHLQWAGIAPDRSVVVVQSVCRVEVWEPRRLDMHLRTANRQIRELDTAILREQLSLIEE